MNGSMIIARLLVCVALAAGALTGTASQVYWSSGVVTLPDGTKAGDGDVTMYVFLNGRQDAALKMKEADLYALINTDPMPDINAKLGIQLTQPSAKSCGDPRWLTYNR